MKKDNPSYLKDARKSLKCIKKQVCPKEVLDIIKHDFRDPNRMMEPPDKLSDLTWPWEDQLAGQV